MRKINPAYSREVNIDEKLLGGLLNEIESYNEFRRRTAYDDSDYMVDWQLTVKYSFDLIAEVRHQVLSLLPSPKVKKSQREFRVFIKEWLGDYSDIDGLRIFASNYSDENKQFISHFIEIISLVNKIYNPSQQQLSAITKITARYFSENRAFERDSRCFFDGAPSLLGKVMDYVFIQRLMGKSPKFRKELWRARLLGENEEFSKLGWEYKRSIRRKRRGLSLEEKTLLHSGLPELKQGCLSISDDPQQGALSEADGGLLTPVKKRSEDEE